MRVKRGVKRIVPARLYRHVEPGWHRRAVGGMWEELGRLQLDFLVGQGLRPDHYFLDVGCGSLRGGVHFIRYLEAGHYYGFDRSPERLEAGRDVELPRSGLVGQAACARGDRRLRRRALRPRLRLRARPVGLHAHPARRHRALPAERRRGARTGRALYATFNERSGEAADHVDRSELPYGKDPIERYEFSVFEELCRAGPLSVEYIGEWGHPRGQKMLVFTKRPTPGA